MTGSEPLSLDEEAATRPVLAGELVVLAAKIVVQLKAQHRALEALQTGDTATAGAQIQSAGKSLDELLWLVIEMYAAKGAHDDG